MADKEEKIIIKIIRKPKNLPCENCCSRRNCNNFNTCSKIKDYNIKVKSFEVEPFFAVNKIAVALIEAGIKETPMVYAGVALNALLER